MKTISFIEKITTSKNHPAVIKILEVLFCLKIEFLKPEINFSVFSGVDVTLKYNHSSTILFFSKIIYCCQAIDQSKKSPVN
jgi:hypothetical protein